MPRLLTGVLLAVLIAYLLPYGVCITSWAGGPRAGDPYPAEWEYVSGVRMTMDLARVAWAQARHKAIYTDGGAEHPLQGEAFRNFGLCLAYLAPAVFVTAVLVSGSFRRALRLPLGGAAVVLLLLVFDVMVGLTSLSEYAFDGAEWVGFTRYQHWRQGASAGPIVALAFFALATGLEVCRRRGRRLAARSSGATSTHQT